MREILDEARWAPSSRNTQAWSVWVVTGDALERFKTAFKAALDREEADAPDLAGHGDGRLAAGVLGARGRAHEDARRDDGSGRRSRPARPPRMARMADCFGAPVLLVFGFEDCLAAPYASYDTASLVQNVCLAAHDKGLGTCQSTTLVRYPGLLREMLPGSDEKRMVVAVTLGYPDLDAPANTFERSRADLDEIVTWVS